MTSSKKPIRGGGLRRWWARKRRTKRRSETRQRQRLQTREARGRADGSGARRTRISGRRFSSSSGAATVGIGAGAVELGRPPQVISPKKLLRKIDRALFLAFIFHFYFEPRFRCRRTDQGGRRLNWVRTPRE